MPERCLCTSLRQAAHASTALYDAALAPAGIKVTMFRLMRRIGERPGVTITALAEIVGLDRSTIGRNLRVLERQGRIRISAGADERARVVELTEAGAETLTAALPLWRRAQDDYARIIGPETAALLARLESLAAETQDREEIADGE